MIGVVIPCLDGERYLGEALDSIAAQTHRAAEVVVVDNGCVDRSAEIARGRGARIVRCPQPRSRPGVARQAGVDALDTPLLAFLDADDRWTPRKLEVQRALLDADPELDAVVGAVHQFVSPDRADELGGRVVAEPIAEGYAWSGLLIRREALMRLGGCEHGHGLAESVDFFRRARQLVGFAAVTEVVFERRIHGANATLREREQLHADYLRAARAAILARRSG